MNKIFLSLVLIFGFLSPACAVEVAEKLYDYEYKCFDHDTSDEYDVTIDYRKPTRCTLKFFNIDERLIGSQLKIFESSQLVDLKATRLAKVKKSRKRVGKKGIVKFKFNIRSIKSVQKQEEIYMDENGYYTGYSLDFKAKFVSKKLKEEFGSKTVNNKASLSLSTGMDLEEIWSDIYNK